MKMESERCRLWKIIGLSYLAATSLYVLGMLIEKSEKG